MNKKRISNPFEYEAAVNFADDDLIEFFVEDHNFSRFIQSERNIFLVGERGCGKSMTLLYNSYQKQARKFEKEEKIFDFSKIGIYIACTNPLFFKKEYELLDTPFKMSVLSEHFLVLAIAYELTRVLSNIQDPYPEAKEKDFRNEIEYVLSIELRKDVPVFDALAQYLQRLNTETQKEVNSRKDNFIEESLSFYSLIFPLIRIIKKLDKFASTHFLLLIDDAHDLNEYQIEAINSWIAYRDHRDFSFKVAIAKVRKHSYSTSTGSSILEGHDFLKIDMEKPFQNKFSDFGLWANDVVTRRLEKFGILKTKPIDFFPISETFENELKKYEIQARTEAERNYAEDENKQKKVNDFVYKYARARYFKNRPSHANLPQYSGWETIIHLSTGVIRNLLYPCYWMYDKEYSTLSSNNAKVESIHPPIQDAIIKEKSQELWNKIANDLFYNIENCSTLQATQIKHLFENLVILFKERLSSDLSEPRAITFSISGMDKLNQEMKKDFEKLLRISKEAQILYERISSGKDSGTREPYYVPNRMLFPIRGLDVVGQHARVSLKATELYAAAVDNKKINAPREAEEINLFDNEN